MMDLRSIARATSGEIVAGRQVAAPGPNHSRQDRSLIIWLSSTSLDGFTVHSHAGDDWRVCRDYVRDRLGLERGSSNLVNTRFGISALTVEDRPFKSGTVPDLRNHFAFDDVAAAGGGGYCNAGRGLALWAETVDAHGTPVEAYLASRGLGLIGHDIRFHPACPFGGERTLAMVCLVRDVITNEPVAIHRTALNMAGEKVKIGGADRLSLGPVRGGAIKLMPDEDVTTCLGVGEGLESTASLQLAPEFGASPVWSLISAGGIESLPVLAGIECLWIAVDHDGGGIRASRACARRWHEAGREVFLVETRKAGADLNDLVEGRHHA